MKACSIWAVISQLSRSERLNQHDACLELSSRNLRVPGSFDSQALLSTVCSSVHLDMTLCEFCVHYYTMCFFARDDTIIINIILLFIYV